MKKPKILLACIAAAGLSAAIPAPAQPTTGPACQRECLELWVDRYLAAMRDTWVDPTMFAQDAKFTENGEEIHSVR